MGGLTAVLFPTCSEAIIWASVAFAVMSQAEGRAGGEPDRDGDSG